MPSPPRSLSIEECNMLRIGLPNLPGGLEVKLAGRTYTETDLVALAEEVLEAENAVPLAKVTWLDAIAQAAEVQAKQGRVLKEARTVIALMLKDQLALLATLGIKQRAPRARLSAEAKLLAAEKLRATRKARGTTSKKQRLKIKGDVVGVTITPFTVETPGGTEPPH